MPVFPFCNKQFVMLKYFTGIYASIYKAKLLIFQVLLHSQNGLMCLECLKVLWSSKLLVYGIIFKNYKVVHVHAWSTEFVSKQGGCVKRALWQTSPAETYNFIHLPDNCQAFLWCSGISRKTKYSGSIWKRGFLITLKHYFGHHGVFLVNLVQCLSVNLLCCFRVNIRLGRVNIQFGHRFSQCGSVVWMVRLFLFDIK